MSVNGYSMFLAICLGSGILIGQRLLSPLLRRLMGLDAAAPRKVSRRRSAQEKARDEALRAAWAELDAIDRAHGVHPEQTGDIEDPAPEQAKPTNFDPEDFPLDVTVHDLHLRLGEQEAEVRAIAKRLLGDSPNPNDFRRLREAERTHAAIAAKIGRIAGEAPPPVRHRIEEATKLRSTYAEMGRRMGGMSVPLIISESRDRSVGYTVARDKCPECASIEHHIRGVGAGLPREGCDDGWHEGGPVPVVADPELIASQWGRDRRGPRKPPRDPKFPGTR